MLREYKLNQNFDGPLTATETVNGVMVKTFSLTNRQGYIAKSFAETSPNSLNQYLATVAGVSIVNTYVLRNVVQHARTKSPDTDWLAEKQKGSILKLYNNLFNPTEYKTPLTGFYLGDYIGVEIECFIPYASLGVVNDTQARHTLNKLLQDSKIKNVCTTSDPSIKVDGAAYAVEICILFKRGQDDNLKDLCELLNDLKADVNKSCGLHVHLDCRDLRNKGETKKINMHKASIRGRRLLNALPVLAGMVPKSRRNSKYCKLNTDVCTDIDDRYRAINMTSLKSHKTIEVRLHSGTVNYTKIINWVEILYRISRATRLTKTKALSVLQLISLAGLDNLADDTLENYIFARTELFKTEGTQPEEREPEPEEQDDVDSYDDTTCSHCGYAYSSDDHGNECPDCGHCE